MYLWGRKIYAKCKLCICNIYMYVEMIKLTLKLRQNERNMLRTIARINSLLREMSG